MKDKRMSLEILRIISCFCVVVSHTNCFAFDNISIGQPTWWILVLYHILSKIAVPIFFMISGALYLKKEYSYKEMIRKTFFRLIVPLFIFSIIIYFKRTPTFTIDNSIKFIKDFLGNKILGNYWFIYALIGLYLATPFLQKMCKNMNEKDYKYFIIYTVLVIIVFPNLKHYNIISLAPEFTIPLISTYVSYYILGNYFINHKINLSKKEEIALIVCTIFTLILGVIMTYVDQAKLQFKEYYYGNFNTITVFLLTICIIYFILKFFDNKEFGDKSKRLITTFSGATFGVYLSHGILLGHTKFIYIFLERNLNLFLSIVIYQIILTVGLMSIISIIKKIPVIKNIF